MSELIYTIGGCTILVSYLLTRDCPHLDDKERGVDPSRLRGRRTQRRAESGERRDTRFSGRSFEPRATDRLLDQPMLDGVAHELGVVLKTQFVENAGAVRADRRDP